MTEITFLFNAADKLDQACRVARKLLRQERRLVVQVPSAAVNLLDRRLWDLAPHDFLAHCREGDAADLVDASPIFLTEDAARAPHADVLLNLQGAVPEGFGGFERLIEIVSAHDPDDQAAARQRWKHYVHRGYRLEGHDLAKRGN